MEHSHGLHLLLIVFNHLGLKIDKTNLEQRLKIGFANNLRLEENKDLPSKSTLNEKMSDIIGETSINFNENIKITNSFLIIFKFLHFI